MKPPPPLQSTTTHPRAAPTLPPPPLQKIPPDHILYASQCEDIRRVCAPGRTAADFSRSQGGCHSLGQANTQKEQLQRSICAWSLVDSSATSLRTPRSYLQNSRPPARPARNSRQIRGFPRSSAFSSSVRSVLRNSLALPHSRRVVGCA